ncbi:MAG TPA: hypothetical protein VK809_06925 [Bacteroidia bacterium]|jgi:hypothetical protein|nr:hypothetical protein [Bacteroidia bacterium]
MKWSRADSYGVFGIITGVCAILVTWEVSQQQQSIKGFDTLLTVVNRQLEINEKTQIELNKNTALIDSQLVINEKTQADLNKNAALADEGNMYIFSAAVYKLGAIIDTKSTINKWDKQKKTSFLNMVKNILETQMNNPYLVKNKQLFKPWMNAYKRSYFFVNGADGLELTDEKGRVLTDDQGRIIITEPERENLRLDELGKKFQEDFNSCWDAANNAYLSATKSLKGDSRFTNN